MNLGRGCRSYQSSWRIVPPTIDTICNRDHDSSIRIPACAGTRAPNQPFDLSITPDDHGHPRAALDTNDPWICRIRSQHPVESNCQLSCRRHLGYSSWLAVTAMQILSAKFRVIPHRALRRFHQQHPQKTIALLADRVQSLMPARTVLPRDQPQVTRHMFPAPEPLHITILRTKAIDLTAPTPDFVNN